MSSAWEAFQREEDEKLKKIEEERNRKDALRKKEEEEYSALFEGKSELQIAKIKAQIAAEKKKKEEKAAREAREKAKENAKKSQEDLFSRMERQRKEAEKAARELELATKRYRNGSKYVGEFNATGDLTRLPHGFGELFRGDGSIQYEGDWRYGMMHGKGKYTWSNDDSWDGTFSNDLHHGIGTYRYSGKAKVTRDAVYKRGRRVCWLDEMMDEYVEISFTKYDVKRGIITAFNADKKQHFVKFDMQNGRWLDLTLIDFRLMRQSGKFQVVLPQEDET